MTAPRVLLLPGLHGTTELFDAFIANAPTGFITEAVPLAMDEPQSYRRLAEQVAQVLPSGPIHIVAESFSGPLAVLLATKVRSVRSVVLCATFVRPPVPAGLNHLPDWILRLRPPTAAVATFMSGGNWKVAKALTSAISHVDRSVLAGRIREVMRVDVTAELSALAIPTLYIRATRDRLVSARAAQQIHDANPRCRIVDMDAPHLVLQTQPREAWHVIKQFLDDAAAATALTGAG